MKTWKVETEFFALEIQKYSLTCRMLQISRLVANGKLKQCSRPGHGNDISDAALCVVRFQELNRGLWLVPPLALKILYSREGVASNPTDFDRCHVTQFPSDMGERLSCKWQTGNFGLNVIVQITLVFAPRKWDVSKTRILVRHHSVNSETLSNNSNKLNQPSQLYLTESLN